MRRQHGLGTSEAQIASVVQILKPAGGQKGGHVSYALFQFLRYCFSSLLVCGIMRLAHHRCSAGTGSALDLRTGRRRHVHCAGALH